MAIVVLDDYQQAARDYADWALLDEDVDFVHEHLTGAALIERIRDAEVIVAMRERTGFDRAVLEALPNLGLLITTGMHNASFDLETARKRGVTVCGTGQLEGVAAEMTWALIQAAARMVPQSDHDMRQGQWQKTIGLDLEGRTLGLIGLGRLGQRVSRVGQAFGMRVQAWSQNLDPEVARSVGVEAVSKQRLLETSDIVSLHLRLSERSRGILGAADLARLRAGAILVNTARGPLIDEAALIKALAEGRIRAGLDVYDTEPLPVDHPLRGLPNVVLTPHLGYVTEGSYAIYYPDAVENIRAWRSGTPVRVIS